ncbi:MAG: transporter substrate-binding domain-containing protein [Candidatus Dormibacter sp.]
MGVLVGPPWILQDPNTNAWVGPSEDIAVAVAKALGVKLNNVNLGNGEQIPAIQSGRLDMSVVPFFATPARLAVVGMTKWTSGGLCFVALKSNSKVNSLSDLNNSNVKIGNFVSGGQLQLTQSTYPLAQEVTRAANPGENAMFPEVESSAVDVAVIDASFYYAVQARFPDMKTIPTDCFTNPALSTPIAVAYPKGDAGLASFVGQTISDIQPSVNTDLAKYADPKYLGLVP